MKDFGKYINLVLDDAKEDFLKDNELPELDKKEIKLLFNVGSTVDLLLKGNM
jgi:small nuclear ribonucleoprotein (snRNP)-like protein